MYSKKEKRNIQNSNIPRNRAGEGDSIDLLYHFVCVINIWRMIVSKFINSFSKLVNYIKISLDAFKHQSFDTYLVQESKLAKLIAHMLYRRVVSTSNQVWGLA